MTGRNILIYLAVKYKGNWNLIYKAIVNKEIAKEEDVNKVVSLVAAKTITIIDKEYPSSLKDIPNPPFVLFYHGDISLLETNIISIVGSRDVSSYGEEMTRFIVSSLIKNNETICSGLARGVDKIALETALDNFYNTIAVLPSGIDNCYPKENLLLYNIIKKDHLLISEYPGLVEPNADNFPLRNRIISALSQSLFVVEAKKKSGTMITISYSLENGKDIFCLPHNVDGIHYCNSLIKEGAFLVESAEDIFNCLNL